MLDNRIYCGKKRKIRNSFVFEKRALINWIAANKTL
jgi:hypothetical protein